MKTATVTKTEDLNYKNGFVKCACGWMKELGNGFNGYYIDKCPHCDNMDHLDIHRQSTITIGRKGNYEIQHGFFLYFVLSNGIYILFSSSVIYTEHRTSMPGY